MYKPISRLRVKTVSLSQNLKLSELGIAENHDWENLLSRIALLTAHYSIKARGKKVKINIEKI